MFNGDVKDYLQRVFFVLLVVCMTLKLAMVEVPIIQYSIPVSPPLQPQH